MPSPNTARQTAFKRMPISASEVALPLLPSLPRLLIPSFPPPTNLPNTPHHSQLPKGNDHSCMDSGQLALSPPRTLTHAHTKAHVHAARRAPVRLSMTVRVQNPGCWTSERGGCCQSWCAAWTGRRSSAAMSCWRSFHTGRASRPGRPRQAHEGVERLWVGTRCVARGGGNGKGGGTPQAYIMYTCKPLDHEASRTKAWCVLGRWVHGWVGGFC
eukprot:360870-Chlamydomonas_euryale.AAC.11